MHLEDYLQNGNFWLKSIPQELENTINCKRNDHLNFNKAVTVKNISHLTKWHIVWRNWRQKLGNRWEYEPTIVKVKRWNDVVAGGVVNLFKKESFVLFWKKFVSKVLKRGWWWKCLLRVGSLSGWFDKIADFYKATFHAIIFMLWSYLIKGLNKSLQLYISTRKTQIILNESNSSNLVQFSIQKNHNFIENIQEIFHCTFWYNFFHCY